MDKVQKYNSFTVSLKVQIVVLWVVTVCSNVVGYQCFRGVCCLYLQDELTEGGGRWP
jgi:hypothetical protein